MESSDNESDAGASPSITGESEAASSRSSSPGLKIDCDNLYDKHNSKTTKKTSKVTFDHNHDKKTCKDSDSEKILAKHLKPPKKRKIPSLVVSNESTFRKKRRRTKSERNSLAGKKSLEPVRDDVVLDAEIDRVLDEKAVKNNLTAINVKSIIRQVLTDNMVQKVMWSSAKHKADGGDASSGDEKHFIEPKLTRAKTKELLEKQTPIWHIVPSPAKTPKKPTEAQLLMTADLPDDSSGDEEYVPKEEDYPLVSNYFKLRLTKRLFI